MKERIIELYKKHKEIIVYLVFGGLATIVNFVSYVIFTKIVGIDEVISSGLSWLCAVIFAYFTNKIFVFNSKTKNLKELIKEAITFISCRVVSGLLCDIGTFAVMVKVFKINDIIAKVITQVMVVIVNYIFSKLIIFRKR